MCSIIGYCGRPADLTAFQAGFARTVSRGPDAVSYTHLDSDDALISAGMIFFNTNLDTSGFP